MVMNKPWGPVNRRGNSKRPPRAGFAAGVAPKRRFRDVNLTLGPTRHPHPKTPQSIQNGRKPELRPAELCRQRCFFKAVPILWNCDLRGGFGSH
jgi:hypothetical protein